MFILERALGEQGISEADLEAPSKRITALEDRHFPHLRRLVSLRDRRLAGDQPPRCEK